MPPFSLTSNLYFRSVCLYNITIWMTNPYLLCSDVGHYVLSSKYCILLIGVCMLLFVISKYIMFNPQTSY